MSNGQILFYSGAALMAATILLAIFFWIKKPKYEPTNIVYEDAEERGTQRLRSGYPTARLTRRWEGRSRKNGTEAVATATTSAPAAAVQQPTEPIQVSPAHQPVQTQPLAKADGTEVLENPDSGTVVLTALDSKTEALKEPATGTVPLAGTVLLSETVPLSGTASLAQPGTAVLQVDAPADESGSTELLRKDGENEDENA